MSEKLTSNLAAAMAQGTLLEGFAYESGIA